LARAGTSAAALTPWRTMALNADSGLGSLTKTVVAPTAMAPSKPGQANGKLASIRHADRVLVLDNGRVVEDGSVDELLSAGGRFDEFWRQQQDATEWRIHAV
jgi:hypothetical protein